MTRRSLSNLKRALEGLEAPGDGEPVSFTEFYVFYHYCVVVHGSLSGGPPSEEFFGPDRPALPNTDYWKGMIRIWDGDDDPPIDDNELRARVDDHRQERGESYPDSKEDP